MDQLTGVQRLAWLCIVAAVSSVSLQFPHELSGVVARPIGVVCIRVHVGQLLDEVTLVGACDRNDRGLLIDFVGRDDSFKDKDKASHCRIRLVVNGGNHVV